MSVSSTIAKFGLTKAFDHLYKDPENNLPQLMDWADKFAGDQFPAQRRAIRAAIEDAQNPYYPYVRHIIRDVDPEVMKTTAVNFFINGNLIGWKKEEELREKYNCNIPWAILVDLTSACNLHCVGCWAAEYGNKLNLSFEELDDIITQGKEMGVYFYLFAGGEPLRRKKDIIRLCEKHDDCMFTAFTNGTLIDEAFADEMLRVKNFAPAISLEGFGEATDSRRGKGVYERVLKAMKLLHERKLIYGISCCYIQKVLIPVERKPDGSLYRMTPAQQRDARKIIHKLCSNCVNGNCIRLDQGEEVPCPQMLSATVCCRFYRNVLLKDPEAGTLEAEIFSSGTRKRCAVCGKTFCAKGNRAKYCTACKVVAQRRQQAEYARRRRAAIKENK